MMTWGQKCSNPACEKELDYNFIAVLSAYSAAPANMWIKLAYVCSIECLARFAECNLVLNSVTGGKEKE